MINLYILLLVFMVGVLSIVTSILYWVAATPLGYFVIYILSGLGIYWAVGGMESKKGNIEGGERYNAVVVGAGFSGLCMGAKLAQRGVPFTIFEAASQVGGTWHHNTYPGAACDVWTSLYQFTFFQNPDWSRFVAPAQEIQQYLVSFAQKFDLYKYIKFETRVLSATWKEDEAVWKVVTTKGTIKCRLLISAVGALHKPLLPGVPGTSTFQGPSWHSAEWNHSVSLDGKKVGLLGSAASAVQIVPSIANKVRELHVFQRTPNWFFPKFDPVYPTWVKALFHKFPFLMTVQRLLLFYIVEIFAMMWMTKGRFSDWVKLWLELGMLEQIGNRKELSAKVIPTYKLGCKRVLLTDDFLPTFSNNKHVHLVTDTVEEVTKSGVLTSAGEVELDILVYATGFDIEGSICSFPTEGRQGTLLRCQFSEHPCAYLGMSAPNFPNLFLVLGPNTVLAHNSLVYMIECQANYILQTIEKMAELRIQTIEPRNDRTLDYEKKMTDWTQTKNFSTSCRSWYKNSKGINFILWPTHLLQYWWMTWKPDILNDYKVTFEKEYFDL